MSVGSKNAYLAEAASELCLPVELCISHSVSSKGMSGFPLRAKNYTWWWHLMWSPLLLRHFGGCYVRHMSPHKCLYVAVGHHWYFCIQQLRFCSCASLAELFLKTSHRIANVNTRHSMIILGGDFAQKSPGHPLGQKHVQACNSNSQGWTCRRELNHTLGYNCLPNLIWKKHMLVKMILGNLKWSKAP